MNNNVYMHSINNSRFNSNNDITKLTRILESGYLLSLRLQGKIYSYGFAGLDYISLCDYEKKDITNKGLYDYNSYHSYIKRGVSLAFDKDVIQSKYQIYYPTVLEALKYDKYDFSYIEELGNYVERYTDLPDEIQIKDFISLEDLSYITYPCDEFFDKHLFTRFENKSKKLIKELEHLKNVLKMYNFETNVYDIESGILLDEKGIEEYLGKKILTKKH